MSPPVPTKGIEELFPLGCGPVGALLSPLSLGLYRLGVCSHTHSCAAAQGTAGRDGLWEGSLEHSGHTILVPAG